MSALLSFPSSPPSLRVVAERAVDFLSIRGVRLRMEDLVDAAFFTPEATARLHERLKAATPFAHLVLEGLFNPALLELVREEFDTAPPTAGRTSPAATSPPGAPSWAPRSGRPPRSTSI